jgi:hypothetical protein
MPVSSSSLTVPSITKPLRYVNLTCLFKRSSSFLCMFQPHFHVNYYHGIPSRLLNIFILPSSTEISGGNDTLYSTGKYFPSPPSWCSLPLFPLVLFVVHRLYVGVFDGGVITPHRKYGSACGRAFLFPPLVLQVFENNGRKQCRTHQLYRLPTLSR